MESIKEIYRIGHGPSSSHTMGPKKAAEAFLQRVPSAASYKVTLYGTLAATGKGHLTDVAIMDTFGKRKLEFDWRYKDYLKRHPNALKFEAFTSDNRLIQDWTAYSIGGGAIVDDTTQLETKKVYEHKTMGEILQWCDHNGKQLWEYVETFEGQEVWDYLEEVWKVMLAAIKRGLNTEGVLPGGLNSKSKFISSESKDIQRTHSKKSFTLFVCFGCFGGECFGWENCYGSNLWCLRCDAIGAALPSEDI